MPMEIIRTKTQTIVECPFKSRKNHPKTPGWSPDNVYPFFPETLFLPKNITKKEIASLRPMYKADALSEAKERVAVLRMRGVASKIVSRSGFYEVMVKVKK